MAAIPVLPPLESGQRREPQQAEENADVGPLIDALLTKERNPLRAKRIRDLAITAGEGVLRHGTPKEQITPLMVAATINDPEALDRLLIAAKETINFVDRYGRSALFFAAAKGNAQAVSKLIEHGAIVNMKTKEAFASQMVIEKRPFAGEGRGTYWRGDRFFVLNENVYMNGITGEWMKDSLPIGKGAGPLWIAMRMEHREIAKMLLNAGGRLGGDASPLPSEQAGEFKGVLKKYEQLDIQVVGITKFPIELWELTIAYTGGIGGPEPSSCTIS